MFIHFFGVKFTPLPLAPERRNSCSTSQEPTWHGEVVFMQENSELSKQKGILP